MTCLNCCFISSLSLSLSLSHTHTHTRARVRCQEEKALEQEKVLNVACNSNKDIACEKWYMICNNILTVKIYLSKRNGTDN